MEQGAPSKSLGKLPIEGTANVKLPHLLGTSYKLPPTHVSPCEHDSVIDLSRFYRVRSTITIFLI